MAGRVVLRAGGSLVLAALVAGLAGAGAAAAAGAPTVGSSSVTLHLYSKASSSGLYGADGKAITDPNASPAVGDYISSSGVDYVGTHSNHAKTAAGSDHLVCEIAAVSSNGGTATCDGFIALGGSMMVVDHQSISLLSQGTPITLHTTGGTGQYQGLHGTIRSVSVGNSNNSDFTIAVTRNGKAKAVPSGSAPALSSSATTTHLFAVGLPTGGTQGFFDPNGQPVDPNGNPAVGDYFVSSGNTYVGTHKSHGKTAVGSDHLVCTLVTVSQNSGTALCDGAFARGGSLLVGDQETIDISNASAPFNVTGGTGSYVGAHGTILSSTVGNSGNQDFTISVAK